jgi:glutathione S-transferase
MPKLFYFPMACSLGIHVLLEEIAAPFELEKVDFSTGAQYQPPFATLNPKNKVPALLRDNGRLLTEFPAITLYLGKHYADRGFWPVDVDGEAKALELLDYMIATVHMRGFTRIFRPYMFGRPEDEEEVKAAGVKQIVTGFEILAQEFADGRDYILGPFSTVDGALFFLTYWARQRAKIPMPPVLDAYLDRMLARDGVKRALATELA